MLFFHTCFPRRLPRGRENYSVAIYSVLQWLREGDDAARSQQNEAHVTLRLESLFTHCCVVADCRTADDEIMPSQFTNQAVAHHASPVASSSSKLPHHPADRGNIDMFQVRRFVVECMYCAEACPVQMPARH